MQVTTPLFVAVLLLPCKSRENRAWRLESSDHYLTTILENTEKRVEPLCRKGSAYFVNLSCLLCKSTETLANTGFLILRPDNSDSKGRWFESSQAYQKPPKAYCFRRFLLGNCCIF